MGGGTVGAEGLEEARRRGQGGRPRGGVAGGRLGALHHAQQALEGVGVAAQLPAHGRRPRPGGGGGHGLGGLACTAEGAEGEEAVLEPATAAAYTAAAAAAVARLEGARGVEVVHDKAQQQPDVARARPAHGVH